jgi:hypothetical protein
MNKENSRKLWKIIQEADGIVNNINEFEINKINIRASSDSINDNMLKTLRDF